VKVDPSGPVAGCSHQGGRLRVGHAGAILEQVEIGGEAGQRGTQLVRGVGDELALRGHRLVQRGQHGGEG